MSFWGNVGQYPPYYQQPSAGQDGRRAGNAYQTDSYQPLSAYRSQNSYSTTNPNGGQGHENVGPVGNQSTYEARTEYVNGRSSVGTTHFSSPAYTPDVGRAGASSHPSDAYQGPGQYGLNAATSAPGGHSQVDNRRITGMSKPDVSRSPVAPVTTQSPYSGYQSSRAESLSNPSEAYSENDQTISQRQSHNASARNPQKPDLQSRPGLPSFQGVAPSKAQTVQLTNPISAPPPNQSPRIMHFQNQSLQFAAQQNREGQTPLPNQKYHTSSSSDARNLYPPGQSRQLPVEHGPGRQANITHLPEQGGNSNVVGSTTNTSRRSDGQRIASNVQSNMSDQRSQQSTPVQEHNITTVDPSQVFNDYEYQKRKDEEIAREKAAETAQASRTTSRGSVTPLGVAPSGDARSQSVSLRSGDAFPAVAKAISNSEEADTATKDQIELEMKQMIEKMREYKAKDPGLFSQIWEQVKKGQAPQTNPTKPNAQVASPSLQVPTSPQVSSIQSELPAESELPAASAFPPDFDRGRYPFLRRRRGAMQAASVRGKRSHTRGARFSQGPDRIPSPTRAPLVPEAQTVSVESDQTNQTSYRPMQNFLNTASSAPNNLHEESPAQNAPSKTGTPKPPTGATRWPEHNKRALVVAAINYLTPRLNNVGTQVTADDILHLLDQNPSYTQMCEYLEGKGYVINRAQFARLLLTAVPDAPSPLQTQSGWNSSAGLENRQDAAFAPYNIPRPQQNSQSEHRGDSQRPVNTPLNSTPELLSASGKLIYNQKPSSQRQTKENKARKRNFSDIVDLTQAGPDEEDFERHHPKSKTDTPLGTRNLDPIQIRSTGAAGSAPSMDQVKTQVKPWFPIPISKEGLVDQMNRRRDARRCSSYDPRTIARDILISSGKHPTMPPLNHHLEILRDRFQEVNNNSDLSTLKWEIIDPAETSIEQQNMAVTLADIMNANSAGGLGRGQSTKPPLSSLNERRISERFDRPTTYLEHGTTSFDQHGRSQPNPDTATRILKSQNVVHKDAANLVTSQVQDAHGQTGPIKHQERSDLIKSFAYAPTVNLKVSNPLPPSSSFKGFPKNRTDLLTSPFPPPVSPLPSQTKDGTPKKKGRPPGAKNKQPHARSGEPQSSNETKPPTEKPMRPALPFQSTLGKSSVSTTRMSSESTPTRSSVPANAIRQMEGVAVVIQSRSPNVASNIPQHNIKAENKVKATTQEYKSYKCGWEQCPAELHNLETLQKHIRKHRKGLDRPFPCKWAECGNVVRGTGARDWHKFGDEAAWDRHMEKAHVREVAKAQGVALSGKPEQEPENQYADELSLP